MHTMHLDDESLVRTNAFFASRGHCGRYLRRNPCLFFSTLLWIVFLSSTVHLLAYRPPPFLPPSMPPPASPSPLLPPPSLPHPPSPPPSPRAPPPSPDPPLPPFAPHPPAFPYAYPDNICRYFYDCSLLYSEYSKKLYGVEGAIDLQNVFMFRKDLLGNNLNVSISIPWRSYVEGTAFSRYSHCAEPANVFWIWRIPRAVPSYTWVEVSHCNSRQDGSYHYYYVARGSGRWINVGRSMVMEDENSPINRGFINDGSHSSLQYINHQEGNPYLPFHEILVLKRDDDDLRKVIRCGVPGYFHACADPFEHCPCEIPYDVYMSRSQNWGVG